VEDNLTETAAESSKNPDSTDELVRDLEESGYPVDGSTEQFVPQPDRLSVERPGLPPVQLDNGHGKSTTPAKNS
jgi:hypothetical protein